MQTGYQPAPHALDRLSEVDFVAVVGPTAVGKTTLIKAAAQADARLHMLVAGTSRAIRPEEQEGVDFHFGERAAMQQRAEHGDYVTVVVHPSGELYTTAPENYPAGKTVLMATLAEAVPTFRVLPYRSFHIIFIVPPSWKIWQDRLQSHGFLPDQLERRLAEARKSLEFAFADNSVRFLINNDLTVATEDFVTLALGKPFPEHLEADQIRARDLVRNLLDKLIA